MMVGNECKLSPEEQGSVDHVLLNCNFSTKVWEYVLPTFKEPWSVPTSAKAGRSQDWV